MNTESGDNRRSAATDCYPSSGKTFSSVQEMLDNMDPEFGDEFREHQRRVDVRLWKWWHLFRVRWMLRRGRAIRLLRYLFVRRLAIDPTQYRHSGETFGQTKHHPDVMMFEWQKMPDGYRWF
jgi:hypothetical protein